MKAVTLRVPAVFQTEQLKVHLMITVNCYSTNKKTWWSFCFSQLECEQFTFQLLLNKKEHGDLLFCYTWNAEFCKLSQMKGLPSHVWVFLVFWFHSDDSSEDGLSGLGSPSDPCLSPLAWSVTGKYLASAVEKVVNIWQVNGKSLLCVHQTKAET